jgi:hypothetical protein
VAVLRSGGRPTNPLIERRLRRHRRCSVPVMDTEYITADKLKLAALEVRSASRGSPLRDDEDPTIESPAPPIPPGTPSPLGDEEDDELVLPEGVIPPRRPLVVVFLVSCAAAVLVAIATLGRS